MKDIYYLKNKSLESWVYIDFDGSLEELGFYLERTLKLDQVRYDNDMDEPYEEFACCETLQFDIDIFQTENYIERHLYPYEFYLDYEVIPQKTRNLFDVSYWVARMITKQCNLNTMITDEEKKNAVYFSKSEERRVQIERKSLRDDSFQKENSSTNLALPNFTPPNFKLCGFKSVVYIDSDLELEELGVLLSKKLLFDISWGEDTKIFVKTGQTQIMGVSIRYGLRENYSGDTFKYYFEFQSMMEEEDNLEEIEMHDVSALTAYYVTLLCELESKAYFEESGEMKEIYFSKEALPGKKYQDTKFMIKEIEDPILR